jgi:hypothetical protein
MSDVLSMTVAQVIAWLCSAGIAGFIAYGLGFFPDLDERIKKVIQVVFGAVLVAGVTAIASLIPDQYLGMKVIDAAVALVSALFAVIAGGQFGAFKAEVHRLYLADYRAVALPKAKRAK